MKKSSPKNWSYLLPKESSGEMGLQQRVEIVEQALSDVLVEIYDTQRSIDEIRRHISILKGFMSISEAARYLGISKKKLYSLSAAGKIPHSKPFGKMLCFSKEDLDGWMKQTAQDN